jgi:alpha-mannosidase
MTRDPAPLTILVVSHTHWDREWYHSAARFRQRLVPLVDELLARSPDEPPFLLDGQSIILEDYLAVRPSARAALADALRSGRLEAGPWYVLADELIPGGEALVRNLLAGCRVLGELAEWEPPPVLYSPDAFGHPATLPLLASEFGFGLIITWRGLGGPLWPGGDAFRWAAPDGSSALVHHLPPDGYEFGSNLPAGGPAARSRWGSVMESVGRRSALDVVVLMNGADHHAPQPRLAEAVAALRAAAAPAVVRQAGLREVARELVERSRGRELPTIRGELRTSFGYAWSLQGTFAVRAPLKRRAVRLERTLTRDVEPWLALAGRSLGVPAMAVEQAAWTSLLRCHPHDTLCGCSIDAVARAMAARLDGGEAEAEGLRTDALHALLGHDPDAAAGRRDAWHPCVVVRNRAPRARSGVAELDVLDFVRDVPVGPGSAFAELPELPDRPVRLAGGAVPYQVIERERRVDRLEARRRYPDADLVRVARVVARVNDVPAYGVWPLSQSPGESPPPRGTVRVEERSGGEMVIENEHVRLMRATDGSLSLSMADGRRAVRHLVELEECGDVGDTYTPSLTEPAVRRTAPDESRLVHRGPLRAQLDLRYDLQVPESSTRERRSPDSVTLPITISAILDDGAPYVRLRVHGTNPARDHRVRIVLNGGAGGAAAGGWADAAFGPVKREPVDVPPELARHERPLRTAPLHRYVTVANASAGVTVFADGLTEYEALEDGRIAVTLFRGVGELSRPDLPERPGHAGWPAETPEAQCLGPFECELAILLHGPRTDGEIDRIERTADDILFPLSGSTLRPLLRVPPPVHGVRLEGEGLAFGACKRSEDGEWTVLRCVNLLECEREGRWHLPKPPREVHRSRLDERIGETMEADGAAVAFVAPPRGVVTLLVR